jgi:streptomycin 6-kinase
MFDKYLTLWELTPNGPPIVTPRAHLLPVRRGAEAAMLKIATEPEEKFGGLLMTWWDGHGAARVLAADDDAILLERALGNRSLSDYSRNGRDDEATSIICDTIATLHLPRNKPLPALVPLHVWFKDLEPMAARHGGFLDAAAGIACSLLSDQREIGVLHGDVHHDNILDFGDRGWLAIDPKRLYGERGFDYANLFCNPDVEDASIPVATLSDRFAKRVEIVVAQSGIERSRLLRWIVAWAGLSAAWFLGDGQNADVDFRVGEMALAALET